MRTATASLALLCAGLAFAAAAGAAEFRSVAEPAAILYDAPSAKAKRLYIVNRGYPVELVVQVEGWAKVRDAAGDLSWIESRHLADKRMVLVKVPLAEVRQGADEGAPVVLRVQQNVLLELVEPPAGAWLHVRHRDGQAGYIKATHVWGA